MVHSPAYSADDTPMPVDVRQLSKLFARDNSILNGACMTKSAEKSTTGHSEQCQQPHCKALVTGHQLLYLVCIMSCGPCRQTRNNGHEVAP